MSDTELKFEPFLYDSYAGSWPLWNFPDKAHISCMFKDALGKHCDKPYDFLGLEVELCRCTKVAAFSGHPSVHITAIVVRDGEFIACLDMYVSLLGVKMTNDAIYAAIRDRFVESIVNRLVESDKL